MNGNETVMPTEGPLRRRDIPRGDQAAAPVEIPGIAGSLRQGSYNRALIRAAREAAPPGVRWRTYEKLGQVPSYDQDEDTDPPPTAVAHLRESIGRANALLISTPEYNHSVPGYSRTRWTGRRVPTARVSSSTPAAVIGASVSQFGAQWAQEHLRRVLDACQSEVLDVELAVSEAADRIEAGELVDAEIREELRMIVRQVVGEVAPDTSPALAGCC